MRIVISVPSLEREFGGPSEKALRLGQELRSKGHHVEVIGCGSSTAGATGLPTLGRLHATPIPSRVGPIKEAVGKADVVHVLGYRDPVGTYAAWRATRSRTPFVLEPTGMHLPIVRSFRMKKAFELVMGRRITASASRVIATSELEASELHQVGVARSKIRVRPNGVDVDDLLPLPPRGSVRLELGIPLDVPLVLSLGRIAEKKSLWQIAEALARQTSLWAVIVGPDDRDGGSERLLDAIREFGVEGRIVIYPDGVWGRARARFFADADCFCLPSASENFGAAAVEAAAVGLPVVVSDRCGGAEWLRDDGSTVVPYGDIATLANALVTSTAADVKAAATLKADGLRADLAWKAVADMQLAIYDELVDRP